MLNKVKEMSSTIGKKVVKNKKKIAIVAGGVAIGVYRYKNIKVAERLIVEGIKGTYELFDFSDGSQLLDGKTWVILSKELIDADVIIDALNHTIL